MRRMRTGVLLAGVLLVTLVLAVPARAGLGKEHPDAPRWAVVIDPLELLVGLYSGIIQVRPQVQYAPLRFLVIEIQPLFLFASSSKEDIGQDVYGGGGMIGLRGSLDRLRGPYLSLRAGPMAFVGAEDDETMVIMLVESEVGWSWAPIGGNGLVMNGGIGWRGYFPLDRESRLYYVAAHEFLVNYSIGYAW